MDYGFEVEEKTLILSREVARSGRSQARVNGRPATASMLKAITSLLIDVHGQHEHQSLLLVPLHIEILDAWIGEPANDLRGRAAEQHDQLRALRAERDRLRTDERERARLLDLYQFQVQEIEAARLDVGEDESLAAERNRLANAEKLYSAAVEVHDALTGAEGCAVDRLSAGFAARRPHRGPRSVDVHSHGSSERSADQRAGSCRPQFETTSIRSRPTPLAWSRLKSDSSSFASLSASMETASRTFLAMPRTSPAS